MKKTGKERRRHTRYDTEMKVYFHVKYDIKTRVKFAIINGGVAHKYSGLCKNVSVEGLCFVSHKKLNKGDNLLLEVYEPIVKGPVIMDAQVRWCRQLPDDKKKKHMFHAGVRIVSVNGKRVRGTIHKDKEYKVAWSIVLDSLFGSFSAMLRKLKARKRR
jgi:hypothetical protein